MSRYLSFRDGGKTNEEGISQYLDGLFDGEVINGLEVTQQGSPTMGVAVSAGRAFIPSGNDYPYPIWSDASENVTLAAADGSNPRYDLIVAYVDLSVVDDTNPNNPDAWLLADVTGTPAGSPSEPNSAAIEAEVGASNPYIILARVYVGTAVTTITNSNIVDRRSLVTSALADADQSGWNLLDYVFEYDSNNGNKEYVITSENDLSSVLSPGMRMKLTRGVTAPTQCSDLEGSSSQYASRASGSLSGITFTDDFTCEAWVKLESYGVGFIVSRRSSSIAGFMFYVDAVGRVVLGGANGSTADTVTSYPSLPLGRWVHVAASLDISGATGVTYINGVAVPSAYSNNAATGVTQAGNLAVGAEPSSPTFYFDGKLSDVRLWSDIRTATEIRENMNKQLTGSESNLVGYWKLNGNFNDSTSNANNLTAQNSATATSSDNPMNDTEYAIITKVAYSAPTTTITVFTGTDHNIPDMALSNFYFSTQRVPFGFPSASSQWEILVPDYTNTIVTASGNTSLNTQIKVPIGAWELSLSGYMSMDGNGNSRHAVFSLSSDGGSSVTNPNLFIAIGVQDGGGANIRSSGSCSENQLLASAVTYTLMVNQNGSSAGTSLARQSRPTIIRAVSAYL